MLATYINISTEEEKMCLFEVVSRSISTHKGPLIRYCATILRPRNVSERYVTKMIHLPYGPDAANYKKAPIQAC